MGDEIDRANVVRLERLEPGAWRATIGPSPQYGLTAHGPNPGSALIRLAVAAAKSWCFDPYWRDHTSTAPGGAQTDGRSHRDEDREQQRSRPDRTPAHYRGTDD